MFNVRMPHVIQGSTHLQSGYSQVPTWSCPATARALASRSCYASSFPVIRLSRAPSIKFRRMVCNSMATVRALSTVLLVLVNVSMFQHFMLSCQEIVPVIFVSILIIGNEVLLSYMCYVILGSRTAGQSDNQMLLRCRNRA